MARDAASNRLRSSEREAFERDGFLQISGLLGRRQCEALVEVARSYLPAAFRQEDASLWRGRIQDCCNDIPLYQRKGLVRFKAADGFSSHYPVADAVYGNVRLRALFEDILGEDLEKVRVRGLNPNFPFPRTISLNEFFGGRLDEAMSGGVWDRLRIPTPLQFPITPHLETHAVELGALVYLTDVGADGGGLAVWPGSHRLFDAAFASQIDFLPNALYKRAFQMLQGRKPQVLQGRAGDVILFHNRILHANTFNRSERVRHALVIDAMGVNWRERAARRAPASKRGDALAARGDLAEVEPFRSVLGSLEPHPVADFLSRHPKLAGMIQAISKDPVSAGRNHLSAKIRTRRDGDLWVVVSQTAEYHDSHKLDAYGLARDGDYRAEIDGVRVARSRCGILVEQIEPSAGRRRLELSGRFELPHYVKLVRTRQPFTRSELLHLGVVPAGASRYAAEFTVD